MEQLTCETKCPSLKVFTEQRCPAESSEVTPQPSQWEMSSREWKTLIYLNPNYLREHSWLQQKAGEPHNEHSALPGLVTAGSPRAGDGHTLNFSSPTTPASHGAFSTHTHTHTHG